MRQRKKLNATRRARIMRLISLGLTVNEIVTLAGCSTNTVCALRKEMGARSWWHEARDYRQRKLRERIAGGDKVYVAAEFVGVSRRVAYRIAREIREGAANG